MAYDEVTAQLVRENEKLRSALTALLKWAEEAEELIEGDQGVGRSLAELEQDGQLSAEIVQARAALGVKEDRHQPPAPSDADAQDGC